MRRRHAMTWAMNITALATAFCFGWPVYDTAILPRWVVFCAGVGICAGTAWRQRRPMRISWTWVGFMAWGCILVVWWNRGLPGIFEVVVVGAIGTLYLVSRSLTAREFQDVCRVAVCGGAFLGLIAGLQWFGIDTGIRQVVPPAATFLNRNILAEYLVGLIPVGLWLMTRDEKWAVPMAGIMLFALALTLCRGAWIGLIVAGLLIVPLRRSKQHYFLFVFPLCLLVGLISRYTIHPLLHKPPATISARIEMWKNTLSMIKDHPFGVGPTGWRMEYAHYVGRSFFPMLWSPHCDMLQVCAEYGVLAALVVVMMILFSVRRAYEVCPVLAVSILAVLGTSCFAFTRENAAALFVPVMVAGNCYNKNLIPLKWKPDNRETDWKWIAPIIFCGIGTILSIFLCFHDMHYLMAWKAAETGDFPTAIESTYKAEAFGYWRPDVSVLRAKIYEWIEDEIRRQGRGKLKGEIGGPMEQETPGRGRSPR